MQKRGARDKERKSLDDAADNAGMQSIYEGKRMIELVQYAEMDEQYRLYLFPDENIRI